MLSQPVCLFLSDIVVNSNCSYVSLLCCIRTGSLFLVFYVGVGIGKINQPRWSKCCKRHVIMVIVIVGNYEGFCSEIWCHVEIVWGAGISVIPSMCMQSFGKHIL